MDSVNNSQKNSKFQEFVDAAAIICRSNAASSEEIINELIALAVANNPTLDLAKVKAGVFAREAMFPTVIAPGLAMPHARIAGLEGLIVALATVKEPVRFGGEEDGEDVRVIVLVLSPADNPGLHLHVVSALAREFSDLEKIGQVADLQSVEEVVKFFGVVQMRLPEYLKVGDIASGIGPVLQATDSLAFAFRKFGESRVELIPVLDDDGKLMGVLTLKDVLKYNIPEGVLESGDVSVLYDMKPYAEVIGKAENIQVSELMSSEFMAVNEDLPAANLIKLLLDSPVNSIMAVDGENRLRGEVRLRDFCGKIFWE